ncbi:hypothetical protein BT69DRAFT_1343684 [Atractiella rhizophila]|nr:hypothetical protein BT69DRAFT_1343684 [Atractiella rhizophila]
METIGGANRASGVEDKQFFLSMASTATNGSCAVDGIVKNYTAVSTTTEYQSLLCEFLNLSEDHQHIIAVTHTGKDGKAMVIDRFMKWRFKYSFLDGFHSFTDCNYDFP